MKILAIDTATEQCSVALWNDGNTIARSFLSARDHAERVLPMVDEVLTQAGLGVNQLNGLAFGRGPGGFTGVRIATAVVQGLAVAANLPVVGISDLAAIAQQHATGGGPVLVCMDARMGEVYWAGFDFDGQGRCLALSEESVTSPDEIIARLRSGSRSFHIGAGSGFAAYPQLSAAFPTLQIHDKALPHANEIALLAVLEFNAQRGGAARDALPSYVRNRVVAERNG